MRENVIFRDVSHIEICLPPVILTGTSPNTEMLHGLFVFRQKIHEQKDMYLLSSIQNIFAVEYEWLSYRLSRELPAV